MVHHPFRPEAPSHPSPLPRCCDEEFYPPLLAVHNNTQMAQRGTHASVTVTIELVTDRQRPISSQPLQTETLALLGGGACLNAPLSSLISNAWRPSIRASGAVLASYTCSQSAACRLNAALCDRCFFMASILQKPGKWA